MFEALDLVRGCCEHCLGVADAFGGKRATEASPAKAAQTSRLARVVREEKRGVRLTFTKKRISEFDFIGGPAAGKRASELGDIELKRLAIAMPHRTARFAIRRYLRHRKAGQVPAASEPVMRR